MTITRRTAIGLVGAALTTPAFAARPLVRQPDPALWDPQQFPVRESWAEGPNGRVYVRTYGAASPRAPVILLHGGPAAGHRYMRPYAALASGRQVALYDQSGCGRSAAPSDLSRYTLARYVQELEAVRAHLGFDRAVLLGHSWGGFLAPAYAATFPRRAAGLVLAGTAARWQDFQLAEARWMRELGPSAVRVAQAAIRTGRFDTPQVQALQERYYQLHFCRLAPWPQWLDEEGAKIDRNPVYKYLNGPSELTFNGAFATVDVSSQLAGLRIPMLVTCGEFDEAPPWIGRRLVAATGGRARLQVFEGLSHLSHVEDPARVTRIVGEWLGQMV